MDCESVAVVHAETYEEAIEEASLLFSQWAEQRVLVLYAEKDPYDEEE